MAKPILRILSPVIGAEEQLLVLGPSAITLGRGEDNDVVLLEQAASRDHARIEPTDGGYEIVDCNSAAGLWLKGSRVKRHKLADGDEIKVGGTTLRYVEAAHSEPTVVPTTTGSGPTAPPTWELEPATASGNTEVPTAETDPPETDPPETDPPETDDSGMAATMLPQDMPKPTAEESPQGTLAAAHIEAPAPTAPDDAPTSDASGYSLGVDGSSPSASGYSLDGSGPAQREGLSLGGAQSSSASVYSLDGSGPKQREGLSVGEDAAPNTAVEVGKLELDMSSRKGSPSPAGSGDSGYSLEGRSDTPFASVDIDDARPGFDSGRRRTSAGTVVLFVVIGAAAAFGVLVALQGPPW